MRRLAALLCRCSRCPCCARFLHTGGLCLLCVVGQHNHPAFALGDGPA